MNSAPTERQKVALIAVKESGRVGHKKSAVMEALAKKGLAEKRGVSVFESRYFITQKGLEALSNE